MEYKILSPSIWQRSKEKEMAQGGVGGKRTIIG